MLKNAQLAVSEFHSVFNNPISNKPQLLEKSRVQARANWMKEEINEFEQAADLADQADALADLIYIAIGAFVEMGVDADKVFEIVHKANMNKRSPLGEIKHDNDRKVIKPSKWISPQNFIRDWLAGHDGGLARVK